MAEKNLCRDEFSLFPYITYTYDSNPVTRNFHIMHLLTLYSEMVLALFLMRFFVCLYNYVEKSVSSTKWVYALRENCH